MGLANLVPGISGGTMLVAAGIYQRFIEAIAELTTLKFRFRSMLLLGCVIVSAAGAILLLAGPVRDLVVYHRWIMYSIFIGLTLGGVPVVWRMIPKFDTGVWVAAAVAFAGMGVLAWFQARQAGAGASGAEAGFVLLLLAGLLGAAAMVLPGVSGGYLLLVLGVYVTILTGVRDVKEALSARDFGALSDPAMGIVLPVGLGVIIGIVGISNLLRWLLKKYEKPTLGFLLGLLVGAVVGLWPFQQGVEPKIGEVFKGQAVTEQRVDEVREKPEDWPTVFFAPTTGQVAGAFGLILGGFAATSLVALLGRQKGDDAASGASRTEPDRLE
ncbi:MAG: DUF368 domain-containing protein, partial [Planctomycetota bacterium]